MMQYMLSFVLLVISGQTLAAPLDDGSNGVDCAGGLVNGALLERGRYFYECRNGQIVAKGCVTDDLKHQLIGATYDKRHYRLQCTVNGEVLSWEPVACLHNGEPHKLNEQWEDGSNYYTCKTFGNNELRSVNSGCIDQGKRIALNEKITKDDFVFICNETVNNGARLMPVGCVKEGKEYNAGETFEAGNVWYTCVRTGAEKVKSKAGGCIHNGKHLNDGERYFENEVAFECNVVNEDVEIRATGCVQSDSGSTVERKLGCTWVEGTAPFQYELACQHDPATKMAKKVPVSCNYNVGGGVYNIDPGCYRIVDKSAFGCVKEGDNLKIQSFQGDNAEQSASSAGLHAC